MNSTGKPEKTCRGQDIKVLAWRSARNVDITVSVPLIADQIPTMERYEEEVSSLRAELVALATQTLGPEYDLVLHLNTSSANPFGGKKVYILGSGSCIECGEEGVVGRGNTAAGTISTFRPHTMEAPFGKNPTYHAGKVYAYLSNQIAQRIASRLQVDATVVVETRHSEPLFEPARMHVALRGEPADDLTVVTDIVTECLAQSDHVDAIVYGRALVPS